ncbi:hypothetical protein D3C74_295050 [compost metagenome]
MLMFNSPLDKHQYFYARKWETETQLQLYVKLGEITADEYKTITGKEYQAA